MLRVEDVEVTVVTPSSPLRQALLGKKVGDDFKLTMRGAVRALVVEGVR